MMTRDDIHGDDDLLRYVEQAIGRAYARVGQARADRRDVARILSEHGAHSSAVQMAVEAHIRRQLRLTLGEPTYDEVGACAAEQRLKELAACGYRSEELAYRTARRGGRWEGAARPSAPTPRPSGLDAHHGACEAAVAAWWRGHASTIEGLCDRHAGLLVAARRADVRATATQLADEPDEGAHP